MMMQPILYIMLFGPLLEPLAGQLGAGNAYQIFVPGVLVQLGIFGSLFGGLGLIAEYRAGVVESQRVTSASRTALLLSGILLPMTLAPGWLRTVSDARRAPELCPTRWMPSSGLHRASSAKKGPRPLDPTASARRSASQ
jgi:hypothetical protein